ncbi:sensor histidine kinase [Magnetospirillum gryphiswaldense]|uniref:histidine kinase n=1 Tax=Magnetospirillum gryphiswaldense TaxID=55518 RepID=A4U4D3_9PROT|nr:sensor histidine kinase [Magnetospirillum gryphiswaldense]AVM72571.1 Phytochrome-like protein cph1 [Magnetospirillum gryphiswaldense MSR-1]AVM76474.1 Phytochrome-like protein cph1 [Magnetospirillum gryphiswaldense]CAM77740.1 two-component sensor histidine kinase [Magnetospirillum gryphiswaldense MSR-1]
MAKSWRRRLRPKFVLLLLFALCFAGGVGAAGALVMADYRDSRAAAEAATRHQARLLQEFVARTLDATELMVRRLGDQLTTPPVGSLNAEQNAALRAALAASPHLANLVVVDGRGQVVTDGLAKLPAATSLVQHEWVRAVLGGETSSLSLSQAGLDEASGKVVFSVSLALRDVRGRLLGAVAALVDIQTLAALIDEQDMAAARPSLALYRMDGALLAAHPLSAADMGRNMSGLPLFSTHLPEAASGTFATSPSEGDLRIVSYRTIPGRNLVVCASVSQDEAMAPWRQRSWATLITAVLVLGLLAALSRVMAREIRRDRMVNQALRAANRDLSRSNADLEQFAYVASHDLKEPLRNIASYVQLLQRRYQGRLDEDADAFIGYTVDGVRRMQMIINELLVYSRIGTGPLTRGAVQTGVLVSTALANLKAVIAEAGAVVEVKGPLPVVVGDAGQLSSVFQNLISNGLKYRRDDIRPELTVAVAEQGEFWRFSIIDNGIGIDPQYHRQIFELFKRLHARDRYTGTGIGLAVCQRVIERHGGEIWVESVPGQGASFHFTLPKN